ncbi:MAG: hypothetical protein GC150_10100 [Rhizobiales bacterium]|nr:hypothetical protein [Hyphomicrobiales bacterium]
MSWRIFAGALEARDAEGIATLAHVACSRPHDNGMCLARLPKPATLFIAALIGGMAFGTSMPAYAGPKVETEVCMHTSDFANAGTDGDIYVTLSGVSGATTKKFEVATGSDDFQRNEWTCFKQSNQGGDSIEDVGPVVVAKVETSTDDDYCMSRMYVARWSGNTVLSNSVFLSDNDYRACFGDDSDWGSVRERTFNVQNLSHSGDAALVAKGSWVLVDRYTGPGETTFEMQHSTTTSNSTTNTKAWSVAVAVGVTVKSSFAEASTTVTATRETSEAITTAQEIGKSVTISRNCKVPGGGNANLALYQWTLQIPNHVRGETTVRSNAAVCAVNAPAGSWTPKCQPGCFDPSDASQQTCLTTSDECRVHVR